MKLNWDLLFAPTQTVGTTGTAGTQNKINALAVPHRIPVTGTRGDKRSRHGDFVPVVPKTETAAGTDNRLKSLNVPIVPAVPAKNDDGIDADQWAAFEERAAIMEYDGGLSRPEAEARAADLLHLKPMGRA